MKKDKIKKETDIVIYQSKNGAFELKADAQNETIWLTQQQTADLFAVQKAAVSKHVKNIFDSRELGYKATVSKMETVQKEGQRAVKRTIEYYNLDLVLSIGYRVNSAQATQFRIWATGVLKKYLVHGYAVNEKRLLETRVKFNELRNAVAFLQAKSQKQLLKGQEGEILNLLASYAKTLSTLEAYDKGKLGGVKGKKTAFVLEYQECQKIITQVKNELTAKKEAGDLFGQERDQSFSGIIRGLYQTFGGKELYPTIEDKSSHLLYFIIKDHPLSDGNKRTAAFLFVYFLDKANYLYRQSGEKKINDNGLAALALLIAESDPKEKEVMINIIKHLLAE